MTKKIYPLLLITLVIIIVLFNSCAKDFLTHGFAPEEVNIDALKLDFETNAPDLKEIDFSYTQTGVKTKSSEKSVIVPLWNKAILKDNGNTMFYEVPLSGNLRKLSVITQQKNGRVYTPVLSNITTHMVVKYHKEKNEYFYFIATMLGSNADPKEKSIKYVGNKSFNGYIYISDLEGRCIQLLKSFGGVRTLLRTDFETASTPNQGDETVEVLQIQMYSNFDLPHCVGEANGNRHVHIDKPNGDDCIKSCPERDYREACPCKDCNITIPDVEIKYCKECQNQENSCVCCDRCHKLPCQCQPCSDCGSIFCTGECLNPCFYCGQRGCGGRCLGGGGVNPPVKPPTPCYDEKCPICKKCLYPSKPNCVKCVCCQHSLRCQSLGCKKLIRTNTRAGMNCTHAESDFCPSSGPVCKCGERHTNDEGFPLCTIPLKEGTFIYDKNTAYSIMWIEALKTGIEYAGYLLSDGRVQVNIDSRNTSNISYNGDYIRCKNGKFGLELVTKNGKQQINFITNVHTHPKIIPAEKINPDGTIFAKDLKVTFDIDIPTLKAMEFDHGLILNNWKVFKYYPTTVKDLSICHYIEDFKIH